MINVTKTYLPDIEEYQSYVKGIWDRVQLTNNGPLVKELEAKLRDYLGVKHCLFVSNGTIAIQIALKVLGISKEVITTPFSYCATSHSVIWENCTPVFADVSPKDLCIDPARVEAAITENTQAILATHVYGNACDVEALARIGEKYKIKVIYDGAHCYGADLGGKALLSYGDISTCSFHATKVFHTTEGGAIITDNDDVAWLIDRYRSFGHIADNYLTIGINGKNSEFHAAMGLCVLPDVPEIIRSRKEISELYDRLLPFGEKLGSPEWKADLVRNYAYYPVFFESEEALLKTKANLEAHDIFPRRYFYPSLSTLPFVQKESNCPVSDDFALRALSLPLFYDLAHDDVEKISRIVSDSIL